MLVSGRVNGKKQKNTVIRSDLWRSRLYTNLWVRVTFSLTIPKKGHEDATQKCQETRVSTLLNRWSVVLVAPTVTNGDGDPTPPACGRIRPRSCIETNAARFNGCRLSKATENPQETAALIAGFIKGNQWLYNSPLIRPAISWGFYVALGGVGTLRFP